MSVQTNYCNNNLLILDVKQLNKIIKLYYLKVLWDSQSKIMMYYGMSRVKKQLSGKRSIACNDRVCFLNTLVYINVAYYITKIKILAIIQKFKKNVYNLGNVKIIEVYAILSNMFFESRNFCSINLIGLSSLQKFWTMLLTLDPVPASLSLTRMMFEITTFVIDLKLFASSKVFSAIASGVSSIFRLFVPQYITIRLRLLLTVGIA